jgi:hypothetical protein
MITFPAPHLPDRIGATQRLIYRVERGVVAYAVPLFGEYRWRRARRETG